MNFAQRRGGHRAAATKYIRELDALMSDVSPDQIKLEVLIQSLKAQKEIILEIDEKFQVTLKDEKIADDIIEAADTRKIIDECLLKAQKCLDRLQPKPQSVQQQNSGMSDRVVKLPPIELPHFAGNPMDWPSFWDCFESAIDSRTQMSDAHKFAYLKGQLKGGAAELLGGFSITNINYQEAVNLLTETYGKTEKIIVSHLHAILDIVSPTCNVTELSRFRSQYECNLRALEKMKPDIKNSGFVLATILMRKLPSKVRDNMNRSSKTCIWELNDFKTSLSAEIEFLQASEENLKEYNEEKNDKTKRATKSTVNTCSASVNKRKNGKTNSNKNAKGCRYCNEDHFSSNCVRYPTIEKRKDRIKELDLCQNCLVNHSPKPCWSRYTCFKCREKHHSSICPDEEKVTVDSSHENSNNSSSIIATQQVKNQSIALPIAMLTISTFSGKEKVRVLFDQCAQRSMMLSVVAKRMKFDVSHQLSLCIDGFDSRGKYKIYDCVKMNAILPKRRVEVEVVLVDSLPSRIHIPGLNETKRNLQSHGIILADPIGNRCDISVLIGADYFYEFVNDQHVVNGIHLLKSDIGNLISGPIPAIASDAATNEVLTIMHVATEEDSIEESFKKLWSLESIGMNDLTKNIDDDEALKLFEENIRYAEGRYIAKLPWKPKHPKLPLNYKMARGMLYSTLEKLRRTPLQLEIYNSIMQDQLQRGFIEKVESAKNTVVGDRLHYLTHHGVRKNSATTPLRIVFNCSAGRPSLNDCLYTGPSMVPELSHILLRFRLNNYACVSDVAKAFLMISLDDEDRDATRFLWPKDPQQENSPLQTYRFKVILFGATCSQFILNATVGHHLNKVNNNISQIIKKNMYVDNLIAGFNNEDKIIEFYNESKSILRNANLHLREWSTNAPNLKAIIKENKDECSELPPINVLGLKWNTATDEIQFSMKPFEANENFTKRMVLSQASKLFDPLGMLTPVLIRAKIFLQILWKTKMTWDEILDATLQCQWKKIANEIQKAATIAIPRQAIINNEVVLHAFSDASTKAYCAAIYFVDKHYCKLIIAKARVAPIRELTIPQLELAAATLSARLVRHVSLAYEGEIKIKDIHMWVDNQIILYWISQRKETKSPFIKNRVHEIHELVPEANWHYVTTNENPSDLATRGIDAAALLKSTLWFEGPIWLKNRNEWPAPILTNTSLFAEQEKICVAPVSMMDIYQIIDYERFGNYNRLIRTIVLVVRFIKKLKKLKPPSSDKDFQGHNIEVDEIYEAETLLMKFVQGEKFTDEVAFFKSSSRTKPTNIIKQLNLFAEEGIIRCCGRIKNAQIDYDTKFPILLPNTHHVTSLLIQKFHEERFHAGVNDTLTCMRQKFWMPQMRQKIKSFRRRCVVCLKVSGLAYKIPPVPQLPSMRVSEAHPFQICGIDYTGAIHVKETGTWIKTYVCLFTCSISRAVHLELVMDNSTEAFLFAFRRFIGRRGTPQSILTDNSTTFVSAAENLKKFYNHPSVKSFMSNKRISWKFIPKRAPWFGGYWERMVALTKNALKKAIGRSAIAQDDLRTILVEIESLLNDRPLTHASGDIDDFPALTPSQLMYGRRLDTPFQMPIQEPDEDFMTEEILNGRQKRCARIIQSFWMRWRTEYLTTLRETKQRNSGTTEVAVGDVVHIHDECPRIGWRIGVVESLMHGNDGHVRSVTLRTSTGRTTRPVAKLYPLEVRTNSMEGAPDKKEILKQKSPLRREKFRRGAAEKAKKMNNVLFEDDDSD